MPAFLYKLAPSLSLWQPPPPGRRFTGVLPAYIAGQQALPHLAAARRETGPLLPCARTPLPGGRWRTCYPRGLHAHTTPCLSAHFGSLLTCHAAIQRTGPQSVGLRRRRKRLPPWRKGGEDHALPSGLISQYKLVPCHSGAAAHLQRSLPVIMQLLPLLFCARAHSCAFSG